jgi:hypothetical protein
MSSKNLRTLREASLQEKRATEQAAQHTNGPEPLETRTPKPKGIDVNIVDDDIVGHDGAHETTQEKPPPKFVQDLKKDFPQSAQNPDSDSSADAPQAWDEDDDEDNEQKELSAFPLKSFPKTLREMSKAISESVKVPIELSAPAVLATASAAVGKGLQVKSGADIFVRGNIFFLGFAESGTGKSLAFKEATQPISGFEEQRLSYWTEITQHELEAELRILKKQIAALEDSVTKKGATGADREALKKELTDKIRKYNAIKDQMKDPRIIIEDATSEAAALRIQQNREQAFSMSSDAGQVIQNIEGRYSANKTPDDSIYVKSYSGDRHCVDRISRPPILLQNPCLTVLWLTQPDKSARLLENTALSDGGLLPRFLMADTRAEPTESNDDGVPIPQSVRQAYHDLIHAVLNKYWDSQNPFTIPDSPLAAKVIRDFRNSLVPRRLNDLRDVNMFIARWHEQAWRVAIILHVGIHSDRAHLSPINIETAQAAVDVVEWFGEQQLRMLSVMRIFKDQERLERLIKVLDQQYNGQASLRDLHIRNNYKAEELRRLANAFPGRVIIYSPKRNNKGGRPPSEVLKVIP